MKTIKHIIIKEFIQIKRDPKLFAIVFLAPILQLIFLGYAATMDVNTVYTAILDRDKSSASREFVRSFEGSGYFAIDYYVDSYDEITVLVEKGKILTAIVIPDNFEKRIETKQTANVQVILDGSDGNKASIALGYIQTIVNGFSKRILIDFQGKTGLKQPISGSLTPETRVWYNPELTTRNFMVPSIMGLILMVITTVLMAMAIVKEREVGTLEQLIVTPIKPIQLILGKLVPFIILGFIDVLLITSIMIFGFGIEIRGSYLLLLFTSLLFVLSTLGFGLFISTISKTQQQAMMVAMFGLMMPMIYLSGFAFPIENMPKVIQAITYIIPLRYYITIIRGIILKGVGLDHLWQETIMLFLMGSSILLASAFRFRKRLE